jgi:hypothetical protein
MNTQLAVEQRKDVMESWRDLANHPNYQVSSEGNIRLVEWQQGKFTYKARNQYLNGGCYRVILRSNGKDNMQLVHRLVAQTFIPNPSNLKYVIFKDGNRLNTRSANLDWSDVKPKVDRSMTYYQATT